MLRAQADETHKPADHVFPLVQKKTDIFADDRRRWVYDYHANPKDYDKKYPKRAFYVKSVTNEVNA